AILIPLALYWFLDSNVKKLQQRAMREQAESLASHLTARPEGGFSLDLPSGMRAQYSDAYGRYAYTVVDEAGHVLFSSQTKATPIFPVKDGASQIDFFETPPGRPNVSGASLRKELNGHPVFVQVAEDLGHRDVLIDDVVAGFFQKVGWITI